MASNTPAPVIQPRPTKATAQAADGVPEAQAKLTAENLAAVTDQNNKEVGTVTPEGGVAGPGVQAANTVPQTSVGDMAMHAAGLNPASVDTDPERVVQNAAAMLGGKAAREQDFKAPPAYGTPGYDTFMFENRTQAKQIREAEKASGKQGE